MKGKYLKGKKNLDIINQIINLKLRISDVGSKQNEFNNKCNELYQLASGKINKNTVA